MKIRTIAGPQFSLGVHIDFKHRHLDLHIIWWVIVLGNTTEPVFCGYCQSEIEDDDQVCPNCGNTFSRILGTQPLTQDQFDNLKTGDIIISIASGQSYIVTDNYGARVTAIRTADVTNPSEWELIK